MYLYDKKFYEYISKGSRQSASFIVPFLLKKFAIDTVLDVGCGAGAWVKVWTENGVKGIGLDGDYVDRDSLFIDKDSFIAANLAQPFDLKRRFSLAQSLEVAEHLPENSSSAFVRCLCLHSDIVLFSAAPPGQGGDNHVNEQSYEYWRKKFSENGYSAFDLIRTEFASDSRIEKWYRYNSFVYVKNEIIGKLPQELKDLQIHGEISDSSPLWYRARKALIRMLPTFIATKAAKVKENIFVMLFKMRG